MTGRLVVVGVGNPFRGDDGAGLAVAERLRDRVPAGVEVVPCEQEPSRLIDAWREAKCAIVVDALEPGTQPGGLRRFDASDAPLPAQVFRSSTHAFGVGEAIELSRAMGSLPRSIVVYGIEGADFGAGEGLTPSVEDAVERAARAVLQDVEANS